jgi:cobalt/nickel transport system ATP-binding protein
MVTHDLPYAVELCQRSLILAGGVITADGKTTEILKNEQILKQNRLELPKGFSL